jgi:hypothetical protein
MRRIGLVPPVLLVALTAAAGAAGLINLLSASPSSLFKNDPMLNLGGRGGRPPETVISSTIRRLETISIPIELWAADTVQHGICTALRRPNGEWVGVDPAHSQESGVLPGCRETRTQTINRIHCCLLPMAVDYVDNGLAAPGGAQWGIYYGMALSRGAEMVRDATTGTTGPGCGGGKTRPAG